MLKHRSQLDPTLSALLLDRCLQSVSIDDMKNNAELRHILF